MPRRYVQRPAACECCGFVFTPDRCSTRFCSTRCRVRAHRLRNGEATPRTESEFKPVAETRDET